MVDYQKKIGKINIWLGKYVGYDTVSVMLDKVVQAIHKTLELYGTTISQVLLLILTS